MMVFVICYSEWEIEIVAGTTKKPANDHVFKQNRIMGIDFTESKRWRDTKSKKQINRITKSVEETRDG